MRDTSPAQLAGKSNPCAVRPEALVTSLKQYARAEAVFEAISFGLVAQCGPSSVALTLPIDQEVDLKGLAKVHPEMARLWDLTGAITDRVFGKKDIFPGGIIMVVAGTEGAFQRKAFLVVQPDERLADEACLLVPDPKDRPGLVFILL